jgi:hypothetical protein
MQGFEAGKYGYNALKLRGQTSYNCDVLYDVIHDYSELLAKTVYDAGVPKRKIFTHIVGIRSSMPSLESTFTPPIWTAVNAYSIPGFTLSPETCPYNLTVLQNEIKKADPSQIHFANAEGYARGVNGNYSESKTYLSSMFSRKAYMVSVFGWGREAADSAFAVSHSKTSPFVQAASDWLLGKY